MIWEVSANGVTMVGCSGTAKQLGHTGCTQKVDLWDQILCHFLELFSKCMSEKVWSLGRLGKQAVRICSAMGSNNTLIQGDVGKNYLSVISVARALWIHCYSCSGETQTEKVWQQKTNNLQKKKNVMESQPDRIWLSKQYFLCHFLLKGLEPFLPLMAHLIRKHGQK